MKKHSFVRLAGLLLALCLMIPGVAPAEEDSNEYLVPDFTLTDQYGNEHALSQYRGKAVFLNFWATWCYWCVKEMPDMEALYHELGENQADYVILGVASPGTRHDPNTDEAGIRSFLKENGITYPVLTDKTGELFNMYVTEGYPTSLFIRTDGILQFYVPGALEKEQMRDAFRQTLDAAPPRAET